MDLINGRYKLGKQLGRGSFGEVYLGKDNTSGDTVAIKIEHEHPEDVSVLRYENEIYQALAKSRRPPKIPKIYWFGKHMNHNTMVMQPLGSSLENIHTEQCCSKFTLKTTLMLGIQMFDLLRALHESSYVHRDLKPDNFLMDLENRYVYLIDFGLAKRFKTADNIHIKPRDGKKMLGTARYASANCHAGIELSRRDDMESLMYLLVYFLKGSLPWQGLICPNKDEKYKKIGAMKAALSPEKICEGVPAEFKNFLQYVKSLEFKEKPNYHYLRGLLVELFKRMEYSFDYKYDWTLNSKCSSMFLS
jgi:casein kinase 1